MRGVTLQGLDTQSCYTASSLTYHFQRAVVENVFIENYIVMVFLVSLIDSTE